MATPQVSVVVPAHDPGPLLEEALGSVVAQSYRDWQLVVVDDGSSEDLQWVRRLDPRIALLQVERGGPSAARNAGIAATSGDLVAFLDQDDRWHAQKLERQIRAFGASTVLAHTAFDLIDDRGRRIGPGYGRPVEYHGLLAGELGILLSSAVVDRRALTRAGLFDPLLRIQQDLDLFLRLCRLGTPTYVQSVEVDYRLHDGNASRDYWRAARELMLIYEQHALEARATHDRDALAAISKGRRAIRRTYAHQALDDARAAARAHDATATGRALGRSLHLAPSVPVRGAGSWARTRLTSPRARSGRGSTASG